MAISITDLPPKYQAQALGKVVEQERQKKAAKYHNQPTERANEDGAAIRFDSQKEARRYDYLMGLLKMGEIKDLRLQADYTLQEAYTDPQGRRVRAIRYRADFTYMERDRAAESQAEGVGWSCEAWRFVLEDVKSKATKTRLYETKRKMLKQKFGIDISEV